MEEINLGELLSYYKERIKYIVLILLGVLILGNIYSIFLLKPLYKSNTSIILVNEETTQNDIVLNNNLISTYSEIVKSRSVLKSVIKDLNLKTDINGLSKNITVTSVSDTQIIKIEVISTDPEEAKRIADSLAKEFSKHINKIYKLQNTTILDKAQIEDVAYNRNLVKQNVIYVAIGLILGCGIIFILFYFDNTVKDKKMVEEKLDLVVLGTVPKVGVNNDKRK